MDKSTLQIFDILSSNLGDFLSISTLTKKIKEKYGNAYYANIYQKIQKLKKQNLINLDQIGRTSLIELNFQNYLLLDFLTEMDIEKKRKFFKNKPELLSILIELEQSMNNICSIRTFGSIKIERNIKLNRIELLFLLKKSSNYHSQTIWIHKRIFEIQKKYNIQITGLIITQNKFSELTGSNEINPIREFLPCILNLFCPQSFWREIKSIKDKSKIRTVMDELKPTKISETDLFYNLNRFGYKEFGWKIETGKKICIEYIIMAMLLRNDFRLFEAIAIIISKNKFDTNLLIFLCQKFHTSEKLLGLLKAIKEIKSENEIIKTIEILDSLQIKETPTNKQDIIEKMRRYNAT
ncbi:MAG: hypothetical protein IAX21_08400 [Candidatus Bathyarchaeota archaeon]|nr:MAG: hypothetical protein IAX21_08400 [Candidatus Bathyarchaeota archaeon]